MNEKILLLSLFISSQAFALDFVSPIDFRPTKANKQAVIEFIKQNTFKKMSEIDMTDPASLRLAEEDELADFKKLTKLKNIPLLEKAIKTVCDLDLCEYGHILLEYADQLEASNKELTW